jgi:class 3 adenylate cyclase
MPQFALSVACAHLSVDPRDPLQFELTENDIELHPPDGSPTSIPVRTEITAERGLEAGTLFEVPFRGRRDGQYEMFDNSKERGATAAHVIPVTRIGQLFERRDALRDNNAKADKLIGFFLAKISQAEVDEFNAVQLSPDEFVQRRAWLTKLVNHPQLNVLEADYHELKPEEMDDDAKTFLGNYRNLERNIAKNDELVAEIASRRDELRSLIQDRAIIFGFAASGMVDKVSTALHDTLPGAMVHAAIVNAILGGGEMWRKAPLWLNVDMTLLLGTFATWIVTCRGQYRAHLAALALLIAYTLVNGFVIFDLGNYILTLGYPMIVIAGVWGVITARRALVEALDRAKVESEFRTYVDPTLVDYVLANKTGGRIRAQRREMSIVFVDLENFTAGAEQLKSRAARVVNFYMDTMVRIIRANGGYVNKFLGDGIMFFFNAPNENEKHAPCAVRTVLEIQTALNRVLAGRKRSRTGFKVRAGISTGVVTVGDAGSSDASDYTVLGDIANLGSRLESANKQFGTNCAVMHRTVELCNGEFLMRPLGRFRVAGRAEPVDVFEPIALTEHAVEQQRACAQATAEMVQLFKRGDFAGCLAAIDRLEAVDHPTKLTELYRRECNRLLASPPAAQSECGIIDLKEK